MFKKFLCLFLLAIAVMTAYGCNSAPVNAPVTTVNQSTTDEPESLPDFTTQPDTSSSEPTIPYFRLSALPKLEPFEAESEIYGRFYTERTEKLIARSDYGELLVFKGKPLSFRDPETGSFIYMEKDVTPTYGLATLDGKIVVDTVYSRIRRYNTENGKSIFVLNRYLESGEGSASIAASDGSWVVDGNFGYILKPSDGRIVAESSMGNYDEMETYDRDYSIYDYNGKLLFTVNDVSYMTEYNCGMAGVNIERYGEEGENLGDGWFVDKDGKKVISGYKYCGSFEDNGYAIANTEESSGYINTSGEWFEEIPDSEDVYFTTDELTRVVNEESGLCAMDSHNDYCNGIYSVLFYCKDSDNMGYLFGKDGKTILKLKDLHRVLAYDEYCICASTRVDDRGRLYIFDRENGKELKSMEITYGEYESTSVSVSAVFDDYHAIAYINNYFLIDMQSLDYQHPSYLLFNTKEKRYLFEDEINDSIMNIDYVDGKLYFLVYEGNYSLLYDENFNIVMRLRTNSDD